MTLPPILLWLRRDFRLADHPALCAAVQSGHPVIPLFICDPLVETLGAAPKWRMGLAIESFSSRLESLGSRLILRRGDALGQLQSVLAETGAKTVFWSRAYDPDSVARDKLIKSTLKDQGIDARSFEGHLIFEPWALKTKSGGPFKVYTPFWRAASSGPQVAAPEPRVAQLRSPEHWPASDELVSWELGRAMNRGAVVVQPHLAVGEAAAQKRLQRFLENAVCRYKAERDFPTSRATSGLSENLTYGEISARQLWYAGYSAMQAKASGAEHFCKELVWREFAYHLMWNFPDLATKNWRSDWNKFGWRADNADAEAWRRGVTGEDFVDAAMRELYVTGTMHNRLRMIVASYLTKHLLTDWRVGRAWFEDTLVDWDPASNAMGWQWVAGCGPDAAPFFRVFNPATQAEKFDADRGYRQRFLDIRLGSDAAAFYNAVPRKWGMSVSDKRPKPIVELPDGRNKALAAYDLMRGKIT